MKAISCMSCGREYKSQEDYLRDTTRFRVCSRGNLWFECSCHSCLILKKGEYEWYSPTQNMSESAASVFSSIAALKAIPAIPTAILELQTIIADERTSSKDIEVALKKAPNIAVKLIQAANTVKPAQTPTINSLEHAISFVGRKAVSELVLAAGIESFSFNSKHFNHDSYWEEAIMCGKIAEFIASKQAPHIPADEAYIAGSMANIGKVVAAICFPDQIDCVSDLVNDAKLMLNWGQAELKADMIGHSTLGEVAGALWGFPEAIVHAIANHHQSPDKVRSIAEDDVDFMDDEESESSSEEGVTLQQLVALANQYMHWIQLQPHRMDPNLYHAYLACFNLSEVDGEALADQMLSLRD